MFYLWLHLHVDCWHCYNALDCPKLVFFFFSTLIRRLPPLSSSFFLADDNRRSLSSNVGSGSGVVVFVGGGIGAGNAGVAGWTGTSNSLWACNGFRNFDPCLSSNVSLLPVEKIVSRPFKSFNSTPPSSTSYRSGLPRAFVFLWFLKHDTCFQTWPFQQTFVDI